MKLPEPFGPYLLLRRLGSGGMADVYLASATGVGGFEKLLCLKMIRDQFADDREFIRLLVDEAKIVSKLEHPNVAQVFNLGRIDGQYFIAMELVDGVDLFRVLREATAREVFLPLEAAARIVREVATGLAAAHEAKDADGRPLQIIHRDISPHNVMLSFEGAVKIIDFGVAKAALRTVQTDQGVIKGKYNYLSPEQARGETVDHRTDLFSAGVVLFEALAAQPLYAGDHVGRILEQAKQARMPDLRTIREDVPAELARIVERALAKNARERYASGTELANDLDAFLASRETTYGPAQLAELVGWLCPEGSVVPEVGRTSLTRMSVQEYVSTPDISIVAAPRVSVSATAPPRPPTTSAAPRAPTAPRPPPPPPSTPLPRRAAAASARPQPGSPPEPGRPAAPPAGPLPLPLAAPAPEARAPAPSSPPPDEDPHDTTPTQPLTAARAKLLAPVAAAAHVGAAAPAAAVVDAGTGTAAAVAPARAPGRRGRRFVLAGLLSTLVVLGGLGAAALWWLNAQKTTLEVTSMPSGAEVKLDGVVVGVTPLSRERSLDVGERYNLELRLPGYDPWSSTLVASEGSARVDAVLVERRATLRVESTPPGADVAIDGRRRGRTPLEIAELPIDRDLRVDVTLSGYVPFTTVPQFGPDHSARVVITLAPELARP